LPDGLASRQPRHQQLPQQVHHLRLDGDGRHLAAAAAAATATAQVSPTTRCTKSLHRTRLNVVSDTWQQQAKANSQVCQTRYTWGGQPAAHLAGAVLSSCNTMTVACLSGKAWHKQHNTCPVIPPHHKHCNVTCIRFMSGNSNLQVRSTASRFL
jgi:hypothetical protein